MTPSGFVSLDDVSANALYVPVTHIGDLGAAAAWEAPLLICVLRLIATRLVRRVGYGSDSHGICLSRMWP